VEGTVTAQMILDVGPITFTTPSSTRFYFQPGIVLVNSTIDMLEAYSDPFQGKDTLQPQTYIGYSVDLSGNLSQLNGITSWINAFTPQTVPAFSLDYQARAFNGPSSGSDFAEYFDTINMDGTATFRIAVVDMSGASPVVHTVGTNITVNPVSKTLTDNITGELGTLVNGNSSNEEIFEVAGAPSAGMITGTFMIFNSVGSVVVAPNTGFNFTDGKAHTFGVGAWSKTSFGQLVEVWNGTTNLADLKLSTINATTGAVTTGWTAATELTTITRIRWQFVSPAGAGMIVVADGSDAGGRGFFQYVIDDSSVTGGTGGTILKSLATHYTGTVTQDASIFASGIANEYVLDWVDGSGLTLELIDSSLNVLETYTIPEANGTSSLQNLGDGRLFVDYRVQTSTSSVDKYVILDTQLTNPPPPAGTTADMIMSNPSDGTYEVYNVGGNAILAAYQLGQVGTPWTFAALGTFQAGDSSDMLLRNSSTGAFQAYYVSNNNITGSTNVGTVGLDWNFSGTGNFDGTSNTINLSELLLRNAGSGSFELYHVAGGGVLSGSSVAAVGNNLQVSGFGNFSGSNTTQMIMEQANEAPGTNAYWLYTYDPSAAAFAGQVGGTVGNNLSVVGFGDLLGNGMTQAVMQQDNGNFWLYTYSASTNSLSGQLVGAIGSNFHVVGFGSLGTAGQDEMLMQDAAGNFEVYQYNASLNAFVGNSMGAVGAPWALDGIAADSPSTAGISTAQLVQAMAGFSDGSSAAGGLNTAPLSADTSQQTFLTIPQHA